MPATTVVYVVDDDASVRRGISRLLISAGYSVEGVESAEAFLNLRRKKGPSCLVLDYQMPGLNGLELQQALASWGTEIPIIFVSGHGSIPASVKAMKAGAVDFLTKPFDGDQLLGSVKHAIEEGERKHYERVAHRRAGSRAQALTAREREVLQAVVSGLLNKQIATRLKISEKTVKVHRARVMQKMRAGSLAELVRISSQLAS